MKCEKHRDKEAVGFCVECGRGVCEDCIIKSDNKTYCKECKSKLENKTSENHDISNSIICEKCGGLYKLKEGESLEDFEACECGGKLKSVKDINKKSEKLNQNYEDVLIKLLVELKENINLKAIFVGTIVVLILSIIFAILIRDSNNLLILNTPQESLYIYFCFYWCISYRLYCR